MLLLLQNLKRKSEHSGRLLVYGGKALNVTTVPLFISNNFWEKKILKTHKFWTVPECKILSRTKLVRPISLNSI